MSADIDIFTPSGTVTQQDTVNFSDLKAELIKWIETGKQMLETFKNSPVCPTFWKPIISTIEGYLTILETVLNFLGS